MGKGAIIAIIVLVVFIVLLVVLYFVGKKMQKRQDENNAMLQANKQYVTMLIIDKKRMKIKDAGLPQAVLDQTPKALRGSKMPIIKAKIGPQIMSLICEEKIF
jgi:sensor domain CHASE-containing protein